MPYPVQVNLALAPHAMPGKVWELIMPIAKFLFLAPLVFWHCSKSDDHIAVRLASILLGPLLQQILQHVLFLLLGLCSCFGVDIRELYASFVQTLLLQPADQSYPSSHVYQTAT